MKITQEDFDTLQKLEESLWIAATRFDDAYMERIFAPDFFEFGCSGRIYTRAEMLGGEPRAIKAKLPLEQFQVLSIAANVVQVTYISEVIYDFIQRCNRSSIWVRSDAGWQLRFHQGTPAPQPNPEVILAPLPLCASALALVRVR